MSNEDTGIYIKLLCYQHQHGGTVDKLAFNNMVGNKQLLRSKFIETDIGFYNEKLMLETEKRNKKSNNISKAVKEIWNKRKYDSNTIPLNNYGISLKNDEILMGPINRDKDYLNNKKGVDFFSTVDEKTKEILNSNSWIENIAMAKKLPLKFVTEKLEYFLTKESLKNDYLEKSGTETKNYFINWFVILLENKKNEIEPKKRKQ